MRLVPLGLSLMQAGIFVSCYLIATATCSDSVLVVCLGFLDLILFRITAPLVVSSVSAPLASFYSG